MCDACEVHTSIYAGGYRQWEQDHPGEPFPEAPVIQLAPEVVPEPEVVAAPSEPESPPPE